MKVLWLFLECKALNQEFSTHGVLGGKTGEISNNLNLVEETSQAGVRSGCGIGRAVGRVQTVQ